jgi:PAS domain S-box-containing protein
MATKRKVAPKANLLMKRKTTFVLVLAFALILAWGAIITDEKVREHLGGSLYIIGFAITGCMLLVLAMYAWDQTLVKTLKSIHDTTDAVRPDDTHMPGDESDSDEIIGLARKIERMARSLQQVEASYKGIVEDQPDLICRYKSDGKLTFVNGAYARAVNRKRPDLVGVDFPYFAPGAAIADEPYTFESEMLFDDGRRLWIRWTQRAIKDDERATMEYQAVGHDITERKEAEAALLRAKEAAEAADRAKSEFLAIVSHELRTPINAIIGFSKMLFSTTLNLDQREQVEMINSSGLALEKIIADILNLSKIDSGKIDIEHAPFSLRQCIQDICAFFAPKARSLALALDSKVDPGVPDIVNSDESRIRQILTNLVGNALKFTERGGVTLEVSCARGEPLEPGSKRRVARLFFSVKDTGIGIPAEKLDHLFLPFSQVDTSTTRRRGGTGLGLIISKRLCELMGGTISVESRPAEGSTFRFSILTDFEDI